MKSTTAAAVRRHGHGGQSQSQPTSRARGTGPGHWLSDMGTAEGIGGDMDCGTKQDAGQTTLA